LAATVTRTPSVTPVAMCLRIASDGGFESFQHRRERQDTLTFGHQGARALDGASRRSAHVRVSDRQHWVEYALRPKGTKVPALIGMLRGLSASGSSRFSVITKRPWHTRPTNA
jgi:hypothetical protein